MCRHRSGSRTFAHDHLPDFSLSWKICWCVHAFGFHHASLLNEADALLTQRPDALACCYNFLHIHLPSDGLFSGMVAFHFRLLLTGADRP